jgi:hypothetical protein
LSSIWWISGFARGSHGNQHTLLNAVLLDTLEVITLLLLTSDALNALVVVVLVRGTLGRVGAV